ncbi:hypothetical protein CEXT_278701 [Caerostris extrusa]|uniref:Uncharacterized protein n=1 Tax=Caerostris extrusa TaxID=172846 RepID=A0AAV4MF66_CAEEX|nr:hypothetical protein CEXT_278701 [Caerostris extrusa]
MVLFIDTFFSVENERGCSVQADDEDWRRRPQKTTLSGRGLCQALHPLLPTPTGYTRVSVVRNDKGERLLNLAMNHSMSNYIFPYCCDFNFL